MNRFDDALASAAGLLRLRHLGDSADTATQLELILKGLDEALFTDLRDLERLNRVGLAAIAMSLALVLVCLASVGLGKAPVATVTGVLGVMCESFTVFIFRRIDQVRKSVRLQLPGYQHLFAVVALIEVSSRYPALSRELRKELEALRHSG